MGGLILIWGQAARCTRGGIGGGGGSGGGFPPGGGGSGGVSDGLPPLGHEGLAFRGGDGSSLPFPFLFF